MALRAGAAVGDNTLRALADRIRNNTNSMTAESRAMRTILEALFGELLAAAPNPHQAFDRLSGNVIATLQAEVDEVVDRPADQMAASAVLLHAKAILSEFAAKLPSRGAS